MISTLPQALELLAQKDARILELTAQKDAQIGELSRKIESLQRQLTTLQHQMEQMLRRLYGRKSERLNPNQLMFDSIVIQSLEQTGKDQQPETPVEQEVKIKTRKASQHHGRVPIPEHLERVKIILDIPEGQKICPETGQALEGDQHRSFGETGIPSRQTHRQRL